MMKVRSLSSCVAVAGALLLIAAVTGCSRKAVQAPPASVPAPAAPRAEASTPAPAAPAPSPGVRSEDLSAVFFDYDSYTLTGAARSTLDRNARTLRDASEIAIVIEGHCDERGTVEYNQALGERRAQAVRDYLAAAGVPASRIQVISYGKERPFETGSDEAAWAKNRRAHFVVR